MKVSYYEADGEADYACAKMVCDGISSACLSDDMDLFVYGCNKVLREFDIEYGEMIEYDLTGILRKLRMSIDDFKDICVLSGTDYNIETNKMYIKGAIKLFRKYKNNRVKISFYEWLERAKRIPYIENLVKIKQMFLLS